MTDADLSALAQEARIHTQLSRLAHGELIEALKTLEARGLITLTKPDAAPAVHNF